MLGQEPRLDLLVQRGKLFFFGNILSFIAINTSGSKTSLVKPGNLRVEGHVLAEGSRAVKRICP